MVMGRDSRSEGHGFNSRYCILDGNFFTYICCKNSNDVCLKRPKINENDKQSSVLLHKIGPWHSFNMLRCPHSSRCVSCHVGT